MLARDFFINQITSKLQRAAVQTCSRWSERYRVMSSPYPGLWSFKHHPWAREVSDLTCEHAVVSKAAQMAFTEVGINKTFFSMDILGWSVLYVLPTEEDASKFSSARFDPALELSEHLQKMFTDVKNIGHKRAGAANLYVRGSRSKSKLKSVPVAMVVFDEYDEMVRQNVYLAEERVAGQPVHQILKIGNPTVEGAPIDAAFTLSTQEYYCFKCPHCSRYIELTFPDSLIITAENSTDQAIRNSYYICTACKHKLEHNDKINFLQENAGALWVPRFKNRDIRGFTISQMYSMQVRPDEFAVHVLNAKTDPIIEQDLYNQKIGVAHSLAGARITDENLLECLGDFIMAQGLTGRVVTMGVDVGTRLNYEINDWLVGSTSSVSDINLVSTPRVIKAGTVEHFEEIPALAKKYGVLYTVVDGNPERRKSYELCLKLGNAKMCIYANDLSTRDVDDDADYDKSMILRLDRTSWLDLSLGRFKTKGRILLARDLPSDYTKHIKALVRAPKKNTNNSTNDNIYEYVNHAADHYAHARNYAEIALRLLFGAGINENT